MRSSGCDLSTSITTRWVYSINVRVTLNDSIDISKHYWFWSYYNYLKTINTALLEWKSSGGRQQINEEFASITHKNQFLGLSISTPGLTGNRKIWLHAGSVLVSAYLCFFRCHHWKDAVHSCKHNNGLLPGTCLSALNQNGFAHTQQDIPTLCSVTSDSFQPQGLQSTRLFCPWNFPGKNTGVGCRSLLQGMMRTQE